MVQPQWQTSRRSFRPTRQRQRLTHFHLRPPFERKRTMLPILTLLYALLTSFVLSEAQTVCGNTRTSPIVVDKYSGLGTLRAALNCTGGGNVEVYWAGHVTVGAPIAIAEGTFLSVTGKDGLAEVHGDGTVITGTRLFEVYDGGGLSLIGLKLSGGYAAEGGAIFSRAANLTLENCVFERNVAADGNGGAVWADGGDFTIVGGQFAGNNASRYGGAVHAVNGRLVVQGGSRFEGNRAIGGGALFCGVGEAGPATPETACSIIDAEFVSNSAAREDDESQDPVADMLHLYGGGPAMFLIASVDISDSTFSGNYALLSGGALHGSYDTNMSVHGCTFENNTSENYGGAITASSTTLGGGTQFAYNSAFGDGGAVLGWSGNGTIVFNDVLCTENSATNDGGCYYAFGRGIINEGAVMLDNSALNGGSIYATGGSDIRVTGGKFTTRFSENGGFIYVGDNSRVNITGGMIADNIVSRRGGALYCSGNDASNISIEGGTFRNNQALDSGGAISLWGEEPQLTITGGTFEGNSATLYGGFAFLQIGGNLKCEGAIIKGNFAGDQGGGIYARQAMWVNSSCDLVNNESPQGAAIYLTNVKNATFEHHTVTDNQASGGSVVYIAKSSVMAKYVEFSSRVDTHLEYSFNRAIQLDAKATLAAEQCVFNSWLGDAVIFNSNSANGSLVLDSCDFSGSSTALAVMSPNSDARIRNAVVSNYTFETAVSGTVQYPVTLVDRALKCGDPFACGRGSCGESALGVLCQCLEGGECLGDGGKLSLGLQTPPAVETYSPDPVTFRLLVSAGVGTTHVIWEIKAEVGDLDMDIVPSSGTLPPNGTITISVTGTPAKQNVSGNLISRFGLMPVGDARSSSTAVDSLEVVSTFYLCQQYEYANLLGANDSNAISCDQCTDIQGEEGVNCDNPGATLTSLPIKPGYWRSNTTSLVIHECLRWEACKGGTDVVGPDKYCREGYKGPWYGRGASNTCYNCDDTTAHVLIGISTLFCLVVLLLLLIAVVFLVGGLDAIDSVRRSWTRISSKAGNRMDVFDVTTVPAFEFVLARKHSKIGPRCTPVNATTFPTLSLASQNNIWGDESGIRSRDVSSTTECERAGSDPVHAGPLGACSGAAVEVSDVTRTSGSRNADVSTSRGDCLSTVAGIGVGGSSNNSEVNEESTIIGKQRFCGFGDKVKHWVSRLPLDKLKILVVVWQILTVGSSVTWVEFPTSYSTFLSWISVVNLDIENIFSASCLLPATNFYVKLLVTTLLPLVLATVLVVTYHMAKQRAGIGRAGGVARRAAWSRHVSAGLLLTFLVFTSASTTVFKTFACDSRVVAGDKYLRADYSISCETPSHRLFEVYAGIMILVYPVGIPVLYAAILWQNRELLNPHTHTTPGEVDDTATITDTAQQDAIAASVLSTTTTRKAHVLHSFQELQELAEKVKARTEHPELVPSMFLWKDFGPDLYYYEVIECGRRMLLTGVLIFIAPQTASQATMACIFAFASLLGFELMRPHMDPADTWLYRLGCVIIFLSNFLALLIKVDVGEECHRAVFGVLLIMVNVLLVLAVISSSWFTVQQSSNEFRGKDSSLNIAKTMLTAEQHAANSAQLERSGRAQTPSALFFVEPDVSLSDDTMVKNGSPALQVRHTRGATDMTTSDDSMSGFPPSGGTYADPLDRLQHYIHARGSPGSDE